MRSIKYALLLIAVLLTVTLAGCGPCAHNKWEEKSRIPGRFCDADVTVVKECARCGYQIQKKEPSSKAHTYENSICTACGVASPEIPEEVSEGGLVFTLNKQKTGYIVRPAGVCEGHLAIPARVCGVPVVEIPEGAFRDQDITSLELPATILSVGREAFFNCTELRTVTTAEEGTTVFSEKCFGDCTALVSAVIGKGAAQMGEGMFHHCISLETLVLPFVGVQQELGGYNDYTIDNSFGFVFGTEYWKTGATRLEIYHWIPNTLRRVEITVGNFSKSSDVATLPRRAFDGCTIKELYLAEEIKGVAEYALRGCNALEVLYAPGLSFYKSAADVMPAVKTLTLAPNGFHVAMFPSVTDLTYYNVSADTSLSPLPSTLLADLTLVFAKDTAAVTAAQISPVRGMLTGIVLPSPETGIEAALLSVLSLKRAALPFSLLGEINMERLEELTVLSSSSYTVSEGLFANATALRTLTLDARVTAVAQNAFAQCAALAQVTLNGEGEGLSFADCVGRWLSIDFGGDHANPLSHGAALYFAGSEGLLSAQTLTLPADKTVLRPYAFDGCINLKSLTVGAGLTTFGTAAFRGCTALESVYYEGSAAAWCGISFANDTANPLGYAAALMIGGSKLTALGEGLAVTTISDYAFCGYRGLTSVQLPASVTTVGRFAFAGCTALTSATFAVAQDWYRFKSAANTEGENILPYYLSDAARAANCLTDSYAADVWKRIG